MRGVCVCAFNRLSGVQHGLTIGVLNIAKSFAGCSSASSTSPVATRRGDACYR
jgi:hypothetical protein